MSKLKEVSDYRKWASDALDSWATTYEDDPDDTGWKLVTRLSKLLNSTKPIKAEDWEEILFHLWQKYAGAIEDCEENHVDARIEIHDLIKRWGIDKKEFARRLTAEVGYEEEAKAKSEG